MERKKYYYYIVLSDYYLDTPPTPLKAVRKYLLTHNICLFYVFLF